MSMENQGGVAATDKERVIETGEDMVDMSFVNRGCCSWIPCLGSNRSETVGLVWWDRSNNNNDNEEKWWRKGIKAMKKVKEWSEIVAGPKWKTFIRRFNKNQRNNGGGAKSGKFQYDPLSYSLNFDEGPGQNGTLDDDFAYRDFSSRYAAIPFSAKSSIDFGKDGPSFM